VLNRFLLDGLKLKVNRYEVHDLSHPANLQLLISVKNTVVCNFCRNDFVETGCAMVDLITIKRLVAQCNVAKHDRLKDFFTR